MRKIPAELENPLENVILDFADHAVPVFAKLGITPNGVTTIGNLFRVASIYALINGYNWIFFATALISYVFDCMDGHLARATKNCSKFGDWYDHISDVVYHLVLLGLIYDAMTLDQFNSQEKTIIIIMTMIFIYFTLAHVGCKEKWAEESRETNNSKESDSLSITKCLCGDKNNIHYLKYLSVPMGIIAFYLFIAIYYNQK